MRRSPFLVAVGTAAVLLGAASAHATHPGAPAGAPAAGASEKELRAYETSVLGPDHAADHAAARAIDGESERSTEGAPEPPAALTAAAGPPSEVGAWTTAPFAIPNYAIHSVVLPTGKVLFWGYPPIPIEGGLRPNYGKAALWDPSQGTGAGSISLVPPPLVDIDQDGDLEPAPIYCSGQSLLPNGAVLVTGGNLADPTGSFTNYAGAKQVFTFDPWSETWIEQPDLSNGRWYPTQTLLGDGRTVILAGYTEEPPGGIQNPEMEIFTPPTSPSGVGSIERAPSGDRLTELYPHMFTLPSGDVLLAGPAAIDSAILGSESLSWRNLGTSNGNRFGGTAVLQPGDPGGSEIATQIGGYGLPGDPGPEYDASPTTESIDAGAAAPDWAADSSLNIGRSHHNTVQLPDGSMATIGGARGYTEEEGNFPTYADGRARQIELYDPVSDSWLLGPAQAEDRTYHSTAVLLPDGRVMSAGDDVYPREPGGARSRSDTAEIYSPPYLFKGNRPAIGSAPQKLHWGESFSVGSSSQISRVVLMAPGAPTHAVDMHQRHVELEITGQVPGSRIDLVAPPSSGVAPPGYYMMFALNAAGVPSVARWVQLTPGAPGQPPIAAPAAPGAADQTGPAVEVSVQRKPKRKSFNRTGRVAATVSANEPAALALALTIRAKSGRALATRNARFSLAAGVPQTLKFRFSRAVRRRAGGIPRVEVEIDATDALGNVTSLKRLLRAGR